MQTVHKCNKENDLYQRLKNNSDSQHTSVSVDKYIYIPSPNVPFAMAILHTERMAFSTLLLSSLTCQWIFWLWTNPAYAPCLASSSWCVPFSNTCPSSITKMMSAFWMVESRWAMTIHVRPSLALSRASWTNCRQGDHKYFLFPSSSMCNVP